MVKVLTGKVKVSILKCFMRAIWILAKNKNDFKYNFDQKNLKLNLYLSYMGVYI